MLKRFFKSDPTPSPQEQVQAAPAAPPAKGGIRIKVDGKLVYEGPSGSVDVQSPPQKVTSFSSYTSSSVVINGIQMGGGSSISQAVHVVIEGDVHGDVTAPMEVRCGNVTGDIDAGMSVNCGDVNGNVDAGMSVNCGKVSGSVDAGMNVRMNG